MTFEQFIPTKLIVGRDCVTKNGALFGGFGKKALLVTGAQSAKLCGAQEDVVNVLREQGIDHCIYDKIENNPTVETCFAGGVFAKEQQADFIIAIGGGSPMDAAKAIAVYTTNDLASMEIYDGNFPNKPLPILSIPTTAGTGSEVTPYSILTVKAEENKRNFSLTDNFSKIAFLDARYTERLPHDITVDTAIDALSHGVESVLSKRSTPASELYACESLRIIGSLLEQLKGDTLTFSQRQDLLYASALAGMAISHTGTVIVHSMGYPLTYYKNIPHGRANGMLLPAFLELAENNAPRETKKVTDALGALGVLQLNQAIHELIDTKQVLTPAEAEQFAQKAIQAGNVAQCLWTVTEESERKVYETLL